MATTVVNLRREKYDVYIGRGSPFGNPFVIGKDGDRDTVIELYRVYFYDRIKHDAKFQKQVLDLKDKRIACYCRPLKCHGDIIVEYLNSVNKNG